MKLIHTLALVFCTFTTSGVLANNIYDYKFRYFALNGSNDDCSRRVADAVTRFTEQSGIGVIAAGCFVDEYDSRYLEGIITYSAEKRLKSINMIDFSAGALEDLGHYNKEEDCLAALSTQENYFTSSTGLQPLVSYCFRDTPSSTSKYGINIEALGESAVQYQIRGVDLYGTIPDGYDAFFQNLVERLRAIPLTVTQLSIVPNTFWRHLRVAMYAEGNINMFNDSDVRYETIELCSADLAEYKDDFYALNPKLVSVFCDSGNGMWDHRLNIVSISQEIFETDLYKYKKIGGTYETRAACTDARTAIGETLAQQGYTVTALLCGLEQNRFVIHAFLKP